eukprot:TRINITY_DN6770_c0_g1_i1.p1 TRINITY_DN6770_c0_g1~~TRINITY_DN6770_c0_g1_i1.p1  ORF type:complete len:248 (-),score=37.81 TRINITY_DN6770_c0_g1_i1:428-1171(-)
MAVCGLKPTNYDDVIDCCCQALEIDPKNVKAHRRCAVACEGKEQYEKALEHLKIALENAPEDKGLPREISRVRRIIEMKKGAMYKNIVQENKKSTESKAEDLAALKPKNEPEPDFSRLKDLSTLISKGDVFVRTVLEKLEISDDFYQKLIVRTCDEMFDNLTQPLKKANEVKITGRHCFVRSSLQRTILSDSRYISWEFYKSLSNSLYSSQTPAPEGKQAPNEKDTIALLPQCDVVVKTGNLENQKN